VHIACGHATGGDAVWAMAEEAQLEEIVLALISRDREDARERFPFIHRLWNRHDD